MSDFYYVFKTTYQSITYSNFLINLPEVYHIYTVELLPYVLDADKKS